MSELEPPTCVGLMAEISVSPQLTNFLLETLYEVSAWHTKEEILRTTILQGSQRILENASSNCAEKMDSETKEELVQSIVEMRRQLASFPTKVLQMREQILGPRGYKLTNPLGFARIPLPPVEYKNGSGYCYHFYSIRPE